MCKSKTKTQFKFLFKVDSLQRQLKSVQSDYREVTLQLDALRDRSVEEDEQRECTRRESQQLRIRLTEIETSRDQCYKTDFAVKQFKARF